MDGGFENYGADGVLQVSHNFFNYSLKAKGLFTTSADPYYFALDLPVTAKHPLLAFRSDTVWVGVQSVVRNGDSYSYRIVTSGVGTFQWILFDKIGSALSPSGNRYGRQIWGPDGTLAFDSGIPVMKIAGVIPAGLGLPPDYKLADIPEGEYAFMLTDSAVVGAPGSGGGNPILTLDGAKVSSNAVYRRRIQLPGGLVISPRPVAVEVLLIDVRNIPWG